MSEQKKAPQANFETITAPNVPPMKLEGHIQMTETFSDNIEFVKGQFQYKK